MPQEQFSHSIGTTDKLLRNNVRMNNSVRDFFFLFQTAHYDSCSTWLEMNLYNADLTQNYLTNLFLKYVNSYSKF